MWRGQVKIVTPGDYSSLRAAITEAGSGCSPVSFESDDKHSGGDGDGAGAGTGDGGRMVLNAFGTHDGGVDRGLSHEEQCAHQVRVWVDGWMDWMGGLAGCIGWMHRMDGWMDEWMDE